MKRIPYGISNFKELIDKNRYYIDKTKYIEVLEQKDDYQFFIRPRRFGKTLFLTMMQTYYDLNEKDHFDTYFGDLYIGQNKTKQANSYIILKMSFANVITNQGRDKIIESIDNIVSSEVNKCLRSYADIYDDIILPQESYKAPYALKFLIDETKLRSKNKILLLIDEYDNFANNIMVRDKTLYEELVHGDGYIKTLYKGIKEGTADGVISRIFVTGVSPIMLDDITSGANIFSIYSNDRDLNCMLGINDSELEEIVNYYHLGKIVNRDELMDLLKGYCDGYIFNEDLKETVYNTDMVLYIVKNLIQQKAYPKKLIDDNAKTDYTKLRKIAENFISREEMMAIIENEKTIDQVDANAVVLKIPNYAIKALYWDYMNKAYEVEYSASYNELKSAMKKLRTEADIADIMNIYTKVVNRMSNRDLLHFNEASCKSIFIT